MRGTMQIRDDIRKFALPLLLAVTVAVVLVPTCQMVGCTMSAMPFFGGPGATVSAPCGGTYVSNLVPLGVLPAGFDALLLTLFAAVVTAVPLLFSSVSSRPLAVEVIEPPPPPEDPGGERLRL